MAAGHQKAGRDWIFIPSQVNPGMEKIACGWLIKMGKIGTLKLGTAGTTTVPSNHPINNPGDTISYFGSTTVSEIWLLHQMVKIYML